MNLYFGYETITVENKSSLARSIRQEINEIKDDKEKIEEFKKKILNEF